MSCPICAKPTDQAYRPFCSRRCADVDLARWLNESYRIPDAAAGEDELPEDPPPQRPQ
ncbi:MAG: DNA gyrase inhibitor YacG [Paracoccaceae bacterium]